MLAIQVEPCVGQAPEDARDDELTRLLTDCFLGGGFTTPERAARAFQASAVRARGELLVVRRDQHGGLAGMVLLVPPSSPARRFARSDEAELHLLAVRSDDRGRGVGRALVSAAIARARASGYRQLLLWTQPAMVAARALYASLGFVHRQERDFEESGRAFLFHELPL